LKAAAQASAPVVVGVTEESGNPIPALTSQSDDGHAPRRLSFSALSNSLHPNNIKVTALGVVDAASTGAKSASAAATSWWHSRRPSAAGIFGSSFFFFCHEVLWSGCRSGRRDDHKRKV
jgi:hypothetical protein